MLGAQGRLRSDLLRGHRGQPRRHLELDACAGSAAPFAGGFNVGWDACGKDAVLSRTLVGDGCACGDFEVLDE